MSHQKLVPQMVGVTLVALFLVACSAPAAPPTPIFIVVTATPQPTPVSPTATPTPTPIPPTPTPAFALECSGSWSYGVGIGGMGTPSLDIKIIGESGKFTQSMSSKLTWVDQQGWTTYFEGTRTYENGNKYNIVASAFPYEKDSTKSTLVAYQVKVTGGGFGETPQTCQSGPFFK